MKSSLLSVAALFFSSLAMAGILRVNNNPGVDADYTSAQAAHDAAFDGDTIYVEGSTISYGNLTASKKVYLIGPGYFLPQNPQTQANPSSAPFNTITFNAGSAGSFMTGLDAGYVNIYENNLVIKRNYIHGSYGLVINANQSNILIVQNYMLSNSSYGTVDLAGGCSNIIISNNYIENTYSTSPCIDMNVSASAVITNNVLKNTTNLNNATFNNNIIISGTYNAANTSAENNLCNATQIPAGMGNQQNVTMANVFVGTGSTDGQWKLKAGSPALAAGLNGEDCGMFGGNDPYVLSGVPAIPAIFYFSAPSSGSGTLPVRVKIKSNK